MKKTHLLILVVLLVVSSLTGCIGDTYDTSNYGNGLSEDYNTGYFEGELNGYDEGYNEGYEDAYDSLILDGYDEEVYSNIEYEAVHYAREHSGWHPEEAMWIIDAYESDDPVYQGDFPPSEEDYKDAIRSLYYFYDYFYSDQYE